ncbi:MAG: hypothetical protein LQ340_007404 [Diploschistes diacapsis]|nr:MAG: hypothetical protein LQ340_007404 [Diploschistes diacapsis]
MAVAQIPERGVEIQNLSLPQLGSVKKQLDDELEHLTISFSKLRTAQNKFRDCIKSIQSGVRPEIAVPLTTSLYVPGTLTNQDKVIVDVGTGFFVEKSIKDAASFYRTKIEELTNNLKDLEQVLQGKSANIRAVEDVLRQKVVHNSSVSGQSRQLEEP